MIGYIASVVETAWKIFWAFIADTAEKEVERKFHHNDGKGDKGS